MHVLLTFPLFAKSFTCFLQRAFGVIFHVPLVASGDARASGRAY
jgi:hypothetical protein